MSHLLMHHTDNPITTGIMVIKMPYEPGVDRGYGVAVIVDCGYGSEKDAEEVMIYWSIQLKKAVREYQASQSDKLNMPEPVQALG